jgi:hypothetical protein
MYDPFVPHLLMLPPTEIELKVAGDNTCNGESEEEIIKIAV